MPVIAKTRFKNNLDKPIKIVTRSEGYDDHEETINSNEVSGDFVLWENDTEVLFEIEKV